MKYNKTDEEFAKIVANSVSIANVIIACGLVCAGGNYLTTKNRIKKLGLDTSHFTGKIWNKGKKWSKKNTLTTEQILKKGIPYSSFKLKSKLLAEGYKEYRCECCNKTTWLNKPIPLELHHLNGNHEDNHLSNLQLLCPNCHALTDNYRGKNIIKY